MLKFLTVVIIFVGIFLWLILYYQPSIFISYLTKESIDRVIEQRPKHGDVAKKILDIIKKKHFRSDGIVESEKNKTTSESQSYGMLIAVYVDDREMFDKIWTWTKNNLQVRHEDKLFAWLWEDRKVKDINPATDADQDIAYALYLAYKKWGTEKYLSETRLIVNDIWNIETEEIAGTRYLAAGNWAVADKDGIVINPSYLAPYEYRVFAEIDQKHNWLLLVDSSYRALNLCSGQAGLAMDWCKIDNKGNTVKNFRFGKKDGSTNSYDALRAPYRVALDYDLNNEPRALEYLQKNKVFERDWKNERKVFSMYNQNGEPLENKESLARYGALLASISILDKEVADGIFEEKIAVIESWENVSFYDMSWLWFGLHFYSIDQ